MVRVGPLAVIVVTALGVGVLEVGHEREPHGEDDVGHKVVPQEISCPEIGKQEH